MLRYREGSQSPIPRKKKRSRRSIGEDNSVENHESNSSDVPQQMGGIPALGIAPVADEKTHADPTDSLGRSALMTQLTKPADEMLQVNDLDGHWLSVVSTNFIKAESKKAHYLS